jgi:hypothetical protein
MIEMTERIATIDRRRCRSWVQERFSIEQMVEGYEQLYRKVAGGHWNRKKTPERRHAR